MRKAECGMNPITNYELRITALEGRRQKVEGRIKMGMTLFSAKLTP